MRKLLLGFLLISNIILSQNIEPEKVTIDELKMTHYSKDSSANAVILIEKNFISLRSKGKNRFEKKYYVKIKVLKNSAFELGTIQIPTIKSNEIKYISGYTYNLGKDDNVEIYSLTKENIYLDKYDKNIKINSFSLPNIKIGSVIEYSYTIKSNYYNLYDFNFQTEIPKIKVIYKAKIPPLFYFNYILIGKLKPHKQENTIKEKCIKNHFCQLLYYEFKNVPAFIEEDFIDNKYNYISRIVFEKKYFNPYLGGSGWNLLDEIFYKNYDKKLKKTSFFKRMLPDSIKNENDTLLKVKKAFRFIRNHYTLNENTNYSLSKSFKEKKGGAGTINLALYNTLKSLDLKPKIVMLSTRDNGYLTKLHASLEGINYNIVFIKIGSKKYFLDAADKNIPFGLVPFKCLNGDVRILDFEKGSYWGTIKSNIKTYETSRISINVSESDLITGSIILKKTGQFAYNYRNNKLTKEDDYINSFEEENINLKIENYNSKNIEKINEPIIENFEFSLDNESLNDSIIRINPFLINRIKENPLKLKERNYPVNFGFPFKKTFFISIKYPKNLKLIKSPTQKGFALPNNNSRAIFKVLKKTNEINLYFNFSSKKSKFSSDEYPNLKELFNLIIQSQNSFIEFKKI